MDKLLRDFACNNRSYVKDTFDFLLKIQDMQVNETAILASFDVVSLYTSIAHEKCLSAVEKKLASSDMSPGCARLILALLGYILRNNYFMFGDEYHRQRRGTAMSYAGSDT